MSTKLLVPAFLLSILSYPKSCENVGWDDKLVLVQQEFSGNQLKLNGYYYQKADNIYYAKYFFYEDGTLLYGGGGNYTEEELIKQEKKYSSDAWSNFVKKHKDYWGLFNIDGDTIIFERWHSSSGGPKPAYIRSGKILTTQPL